MTLDRTSASLKEVERAVESGILPGPTESFLVQYLAVVFYAEMEEQVSELIRSHLASYTHFAVANFLTGTLSDVIKRTPKSDLAKLSERFGDGFKESFNGLLDDRRITSYSNVITARHEIGHKRGSNITLIDLRNGVDAANHILDSFAKCLLSLELARDA